MCENSDKTVIGNIERSFGFLGYHFGRDGLSVAKNTIENFVARAIRLYEQEPGEAFASIRFGLYVQRWARWVRAGITVDPDLTAPRRRLFTPTAAARASDIF